LFDDLSRSLFEAPGEKHQASDQQDKSESFGSSPCFAMNA
jgi:hypothetical protein